MVIERPITQAASSSAALAAIFKNCMSGRPMVNENWLAYFTDGEYIKPDAPSAKRSLEDGVVRLRRQINNQKAKGCV